MRGSLAFVLGCCLAGAPLVARAEATSFTYLYIDANEDRASGGHTAIRFGEDVYHFQWDDGLLRLERDAWSDFALSYRGLQNRSLYASRIAVSRDTESRLRGAFRRRHLSRSLQLELLESARTDRELVEALVGGPRPIEVPGLGFFASDAEAAEATYTSATLTALASAIESDPSSPPLATTRHSLVEALHGLDARELDLRRSDFQPNAFPLPRYAFHAQFEDQVAGIRAVDVLRQGAHLNPRVLALGGRTTGSAAPIRLRAAERRRLEETADALEERLVRLARGTRPDWGPALLLGMARLAAIEASLARGEWVVLDALDAGAPRLEIDERRRRLLPVLEAEARASWERARTRFVQANGFDEASQTALEADGSRWAELSRALAGTPWIRAGDGTRAPTGSGPLATPPMPRVLSESGLERLRAMRDAAAFAEARASEHLGYRLITRNCVSELFAVIDEEMAAAAHEAGRALDQESDRRLGGRISDAVGVRALPFLASKLVGRQWRVVESEVLLSLRRQRARELRRAQRSLWIPLRESNTLTSTLYDPGAEDSFFLFFTDEHAPLRPLLGSLNLTAAIGAFGLGLVTSPFDHGDRVDKALRGALFSLPELVFQNIRKGTTEWIPPAQRAAIGLRKVGAREAALLAQSR